MNTSKIYEILGIPFGFVISLFYAMTDNYLLSIVCLMIIVKLCLLPSSVKQQKAQAKQARLQPKLRRIQKNTRAISRKFRRKHKTCTAARALAPWAAAVCR